MLKTSDFDYHLPQELIAQHGTPRRDMSRLLVYRRDDRSIEDRHFYNIVDYLHAGDCLVLNRTRVIPARLLGERETDDGTGGKMEFLLLKRVEGQKDCWETLVKPGRRAKTGVFFRFGNHLRAEVLASTSEGGRIVRFYYEGVFEERLEEVGHVPLPPYIMQNLQDHERYQTVYAREAGSAAAPTAGLHFTDGLLQILRGKGVDIAEILLHVGLGTFRPVKAEKLEEHHMHGEYFEVSGQAARQINETRQRGGRIVCVGTTSVRTLESAADESGAVHEQCGETEIFITPGYRFKAVDALVTNFHLPQSTLLMLVSALAGREEILRVYQRAIEERYRFFSFGDAMLIV